MFTTEFQGNIFTLEAGETDEHNRQACRLCNNKRNATYEFTYRTPTLYKKFPGYRIESNWSGTARDLFSVIIPRLEKINDKLRPFSEEFKSYPAATESSYRDIEYCNEYQTTRYTCHFFHGHSQEIIKSRFSIEFESIFVKDCRYTVPGKEDLGLDSLRMGMRQIEELLE